MALPNRDHITYALVGINPPEFYSGKFQGGPGETNFLQEPINWFDIEYDRARFLLSNVRGPAVLDVGCGSGPYAATLRGNREIEHLVGIDLDPSCVDVAKRVYDDALPFELGKPLPFDDGTFNTVFSCDVFGHIEFQQKDRVIEEIHRVTASGGYSVHVIESGDLDYDRMKPTDSDDPTRRYVWMEGHIGVETAQDLRERWSRFFDEVTVTNACIYPLYPLATYEADPGLPEVMRAYIAAMNAEQRKAVQVMLGYISNKLRGEMQADPRTAQFLVPDHTSENPLQKPSGLAYLVARKGRAAADAPPTC